MELLQGSGLIIISRLTWEMKREYQEWMRITNAPERVKPLYVVMANLARAGLRAGIDLHCDGETVAFIHKWLLVTAKK